MKKYSYLTFGILALLSLIPPVDIQLKNPAFSYWLWTIIIAGFFGIWTIFIKTNFWVRAIAIGGFINCFFGALPYICFTSYVSLVLCCYFYIACCRVEDWKLLFKGIQTIVLLNTLLMILEFFHKDTLMNLDQSYTTNFGVLGHHMQMGSFSVIIGALLLPLTSLNILFPIMTGIFCKSSWAFLCAGAGLVLLRLSVGKKDALWILGAFLAIALVWASLTGKFHANFDGVQSGRGATWKESIILTHINHKDLTGWGIGTFKDIFYQITEMPTNPIFNTHPIGYRAAHNFIIELIFEVGWPATGCLLFGLGWLFAALWRNKLYLLASGEVMMVMDGLVHFPDRMMQTVPLIIIFLAYCTVCLERKRYA